MDGPSPNPPERALPGDRAWRVGARTVHVAAMGLVLGGVAFGAPPEKMLAPVLLTVASGVFLLGIDLWRSRIFAYQGAGVAVWAKLALLGVGQAFPEARLGWYLAAAAVASVGSHMPSRFRHYSLVDRRVIEYPD